MKRTIQLLSVVIMVGLGAPSLHSKPRYRINKQLCSSLLGASESPLPLGFHRDYTLADYSDKLKLVQDVSSKLNQIFQTIRFTRNNLITTYNTLWSAIAHGTIDQDIEIVRKAVANIHYDLNLTQSYVQDLRQDIEVLGEATDIFQDPGQVSDFLTILGKLQLSLSPALVKSAGWADFINGNLKNPEGLQHFSEIFFQLSTELERALNLRFVHDKSLLGIMTQIQLKPEYIRYH